MALPSSPPLLPEPDLPTLSPLPSTTSPSRFPIGALTRKRQRSDYGSLSSEPLFSDSTSEAEAHRFEEQPRRKRKVRGPWWNLRPTPARHLRLGAVRQDNAKHVDSGVWMGSDDSIDSLVSSQQQMQRLAVVESKEQTDAHASKVPEAEALADRFVQRCLDEGKETVDLSDLGLTSISNATLGPLHQLIKHSHADLTQPPSEDEFGPLTPSIQLYLSKNALSSLPPELFKLTNITVLSLRSNQLTELPPSIARLQNLKELNVAGNRIRQLPWELLNLLHCRGKHRQITLHPNPLVQPADLSGPLPITRAQLQRMVQSEDFSRFADTRATYEKLRQKSREEGCLTTRGELELRLRLGRMLRSQYLQEASRSGKELMICREELIYLASSAVRYLGIDGTPWLRTRAGFPAAEDWSAILGSTTKAPSIAASHAAPSLREISLRSLQAHVNLLDLVPQLPNSDLPATLIQAIHQAANDAAAHGNGSCAVCGHQYVIARAEWVEYWFNGFPSQDGLTPETVLPLLKKVCSWACAITSEKGEFRC